MSNEAIKERLMDIVTGILEIDRSRLEGREDANIFKDLEVDSLLALEIVATIEKEYDIKIEDEQIENLVTFNKMLELVEKYLKAKA